MMVSDIVLRGPLPEAVRKSVELWAGCVAGAMLLEEYLDAIRTAGFSEVTVESENAPETSLAGKMRRLSWTEIPTSASRNCPARRAHRQRRGEGCEAAALGVPALQVLEHGVQLLVPAVPDHRLLVLLEPLEDIIELGRLEHPVGGREQNVVLLRDVAAQQPA